MLKTCFAENGEDCSIDLKDYGGRYRPLHFCDPDDLKDFVARPDDIFICSYPKSGLHWLWEIVHMMIHKKTELTKEIMAFSLLDITDKNLKDQPSPRIIASHSTPAELPADVKRKKCKLLCTCRDPRAVAVSAFHYYSDIVDMKMDGSWAGFLDLFSKGNVIFGSWFSWIKSMENFYNTNTEQSCYLLHYEQLLEDPLKEIKKLAKFLETDGTDYQNIVEETNFERMKNIKHEVFDTLPVGQSFKSGKYRAFRQGCKDDWKNYFTVKQLEDFIALYQEEMETCSIKLNGLSENYEPFTTGCYEVNQKKYVMCVKMISL